MWRIGFVWENVLLERAHQLIWWTSTTLCSVLVLLWNKLQWRWVLESYTKYIHSFIHLIWPFDSIWFFLLMPSVHYYYYYYYYYYFYQWDNECSIEKQHNTIQYDIILYYIIPYHTKNTSNINTFGIIYICLCINIK